MKLGTCSALLKAAAFLVLFINNQKVLAEEQERLDLNVYVEYNPCRFKQCALDEDCRVVDHTELLKIPVAACVTKEVRPTVAGMCKTLNIGSNILNCKTLSEWAVIGQNQCDADDLGLDRSTLKVKYVCHQKEEFTDYKYLSAQFECCKRKEEETPTVLTADTPVTKSPSDMPKEDGWSETGGAPLHSNTHETPPYEISMDVIISPNDEVVKDNPSSKPANDEEYVQYGNIPLSDIVSDYTNPNKNEDNMKEEITNDSDYDNDDEDDGSAAFTAIFLIVFVIVCCLAIFAALGVYSRILARKRSQALTSKRPPTVIVNPNCDDYKVVFSFPKYEEKVHTKKLYF